MILGFLDASAEVAAAVAGVEAAAAAEGCWTGDDEVGAGATAPDGMLRWAEAGFPFGAAATTEPNARTAAVSR